jgi:hypothetical protein
MERWKREFIKSKYPYQGGRVKTEKAMQIKDLHIPRFLYKYRSFTSSHLKALEAGVLWMSSPDRFNDPFDTNVYLDPNRYVVNDITAEEFSARLKDLKGLSTGELWKSHPIKNPISQGDWIRKITNELLSQERPEIRGALAAGIGEFFAEIHVEMRDRLRASFKSGYGVLSLSSNPSSVLMWSHYSSSHTGFCVEYDFSLLSRMDPRRRSCFPVFYRAKRTDATRYLSSSMRGNFNIFFGQYLCILKSKEWEYEQEWRIVYSIGPAHANMELGMPPPSAIILGANASSSDEDTIRDFCVRNGILLKRVHLIEDERRLEIKEAESR